MSKSWEIVKLNMMNAAKKVCSSIPDIKYSLGKKYIKSPDKHIEKNKKIYDLLSINNSSSIFEIGPGVGYFSYICKEFGGSDFTGIDSRKTPRGESYYGDSIYDIMLDELDLLENVKTQAVEPSKKIDFYGKKYDYIVAVGCYFILDWTIEDHIFFLKNSKDNLLPGGKILLQFNGGKIDEEASEFYKKASCYSGENYMYIIDFADK